MSRSRRLCSLPGTKTKKKMEKAGGGKKRKECQSNSLEMHKHRGKIEERNWLVRNRKHLYSVNIREKNNKEMFHLSSVRQNV